MSTYDNARVIEPVELILDAVNGKTYTARAKKAVADANPANGVTLYLQNHDFAVGDLVTLTGSGSATLDAAIVSAAVDAAPNGSVHISVNLTGILTAAQEMVFSGDGVVLQKISDTGGDFHSEIAFSPNLLQIEPSGGNVDVYGKISAAAPWVKINNAVLTADSIMVFDDKFNMVKVVTDDNTTRAWFQAEHERELRA